MPDRDPNLWLSVLSFLAVHKSQIACAGLAAMMAYLRGRYEGKYSRIKTCFDALMCAMIAWFIRDILMFFSINDDFAYIASVFVGYLGTDFIGGFFRGFVGRKTGINPCDDKQDK